MLRVIYGLILLIGLSVASNEFKLLKEEHIGNFSLGLSEKEVVSSLNCPVLYGENQLWEADGLYHQEWTYVNCGLILDMASHRKDGTKSIESITLMAPGDLKTHYGIGIGSSEKEVMEMYKDYWNKVHSSENIFVAGSIYGGIIFTFEEGKVVNIFLGAAAE
jgi:hypothetical protein